MVGVMPISAVMKDYTPQVGAVVKMKWRGKQVYEAEILKISGKLEPVTIYFILDFIPARQRRGIACICAVMLASSWLLKCNTM